MLFQGNPFYKKNYALIKSIFSSSSHDGVTPPPGHAFVIDDDGSILIDDDGAFLISEL